MARAHCHRWHHKVDRCLHPVWTYGKATAPQEDRFRCICCWFKYLGWCCYRLKDFSEMMNNFWQRFKLNKVPMCQFYLVVPFLEKTHRILKLYKNYFVFIYNWVKFLSPMFFTYRSVWQDTQSSCWLGKFFIMQGTSWHPTNKCQ